MAFVYGDSVYVKHNGSLHKGKVISSKVINDGILFFPDIKIEYVIKLNNDEAILVDEDDLFVSD